MLDSLPFLDFVAQREMLLLNLNEKKEKNLNLLLEEEGVNGDSVVSHHQASLSVTLWVSLLLEDD